MSHPDGAPGAFYRRDIDGLRAVAILAVVAYHAGVPAVTGGFVGVDVFFVLSGFLITSLLAADVARNGRVSLTAFYARRVRRLFPAVLVMVLVTCIAGWLVLLPVFGQQQGLGSSAVATALYVSNFWFTAHSPGYFDSSAELVPLLHTWSLAVEEQFYLAWPPMLALLLVAARRAGWNAGRSMLALVLAIGVLSFAWCVLETSRSPISAFYLLPARAWELAVGAVLALTLPRLRTGRPLLGGACAAAGAAAILASVVLIDEFTAFPGVAAAAPVLGTALVVFGGHLHDRNPVSRLLSTRPAVLVGLLSYSWYLWHWPMLALVRAATLIEHDPVRDGLIVLTTLAVAWVSYRCVENPIRYGRPGPFRRDGSTIIVGVAACLAICLPAAALIAAANRSAEEPAFAALQAAHDDRPPLRHDCHRDLPYEGLPPPGPCTTGAPGATPRLLLWGDSHGDQLSPLMQALTAADPDIATRSRSFARCPPLSRYPKRDPRDQAACDAFNADVLAEVTGLRDYGLRGVVLSARWLRVFGAPRLDAVRNRAGGARSGLAHPELAPALEEMVDRLSGLGLEVLIVAPMPEMPYAVPACLARREPSACGAPRATIEAQRREVMQLLRGIQERRPAVRLFDPLDALCDAKTCFAEQGGIVQYVDDDHLSASASRRLLPYARASLEEIAR